MPAIPFISVDEQGRFALTKESSQFLESLNNDPLVIVAVAGKYRTGKSFFLNKVLLGVDNDGFGVGNTVQACTKGLWLHTNLLGVQRKDPSTGEDRMLNVLIVDTEGLGAWNVSDTHDSRIFALALLLSSYFVYNSVGTIDEQAISTLSLVANISKHVRVSANDAMDVDQDADVSKAKELGKHFPAFLWLVRDFSLQLVDESGASISEKQYLEEALRDKETFMNAVGGEDVENTLSEKNRLRQLLRAYFPSRSCATLVRPCTDENDLRRLNTMKRSEWRKQFEKQANQLRKRILRDAPVKTAMGTKPISGRMLTRLAQAYVDALNAGAAPVIRDSWALLSEAQFRDAVDKAERAWTSSMPCTDKPLGMEAFQRHLTSSNETALKVFHAEAPEHDGPVYDTFRTTLDDRLRAATESMRTTNSRAIESLARDVIQEIESSDLQSSLDAGDTWRTFWTKVDERFASSFANVLANSLKSNGAVDIHSRSIWSRVALPRVALWPTWFASNTKSKLESAQRAAKEAYEERDRAVRTMEQHRSRVAEAEDRASALEVELETLESKISSLKHDCEQEFALKLDASKAEVSTLVERVASLEDELSIQKAMLVEREVEFENERQERATNDAMERDVGLDIESLKSDLNAAHEELRELRAVATRSEQLSEELARAEANVKRVEAERKQAIEEADEMSGMLKEQLSRIEADTLETVEQLRLVRESDRVSFGETIAQLEIDLQTAQQQAKDAVTELETLNDEHTRQLNLIRKDTEMWMDKFERLQKVSDERESSLKEDIRALEEKRDAEVRDLQSSWRSDVKSHAAEKLEWTRLLKASEGKVSRLESQLQSAQKRVDDIGDLNSLRRAQSNADRFEASLERADAELKTLRTREFELRQQLDDANSRNVQLEKKLKDQERQNEIARLKLKMDYELQSARQSSQTIKRSKH